MENCCIWAHQHLKELMLHHCPHHRHHHHHLHRHCHDHRPPQHVYGIYWESNEAKNLFQLQQEEDVWEGVSKQIALLTHPNTTDTSYLEILEGNAVNKDSLTEYQTFTLHQKCQILAFVLHDAQENMPMWTWEKCCETAITYAT